jgi:hypothetical protein
MFILSYLYLKQYESDRTNKTNVYNELILIQKIWTICDAKTHPRRKTYQVRYAPLNVHMCTICDAKRPHAYVLRYGRAVLQGYITIKDDIYVIMITSVYFNVW